jgi:hypothetical protein
LSFSDKPGYGSPKMVGCFIAGLVGSLFVTFMLVGAAMGHCAPNEDGTGCENDGLIKFLMFPGSLILLIGIGIFAAWRLTKDKD